MPLFGRAVPILRAVVHSTILSDAMVVSHFPHGPTTLFTLNNVVLRHETSSWGTSTVSEQYPHLIFDGFSSKLGERVKNVLRFLFPVPKEENRRVLSFVNESDFVSFRCGSCPFIDGHRCSQWRGGPFRADCRSYFYVPLPSGITSS